MALTSRYFWDAYSDDHLGLMDELGIRGFMVMGFCIGGPMIHNLIMLAPERGRVGILLRLRNSIWEH